MKRHRIDLPLTSAGASEKPTANEQPGDQSASAAREALRSWAVASRRRTYAQAFSLFAAVIALACYVQFRPFANQHSGSSHLAPAVAVRKSDAGADAPKGTATVAAREDTEAPAAPEIEAPAELSDAVTALAKPGAAPVVDQAAVADAEATLDAASRDRARAEHRAAESARLLALETSRAALAAMRARKLAFQIRDPSTRLTQANARGGFLRGERDKLATELASLRAIPRPKSASILSKSPVARPAQTDEFHFELQRNRIAFIDLSRLIQITKTDAQVRLRMSDHAKEITSKVGPVGAFSLAYELARSMPNNVDDLMQHRRFFDFKGWEVIPEYETRGESYETSRSPISEFNRALNRVNPEHATITLWVYPDSFTLFRQIRDDLTQRGFSIAARPLPEGMTIRGSPMGSQSAAQ